MVNHSCPNLLIEQSPRIENVEHRPLLRLGAHAVSRNGNTERPEVFGVRPDRIDHEVEFVGAIDRAAHAVGHAGPDELGFVGEPDIYLREQLEAVDED